MIDKVIVKDNILTEDECDFLIDYYQNNPYKIKHKRTRFVRMDGRWHSYFNFRFWKEFKPFNLRKRLIRMKFMKKILDISTIPLKLNYDQLVYRLPGEEMPLHKDNDFPPTDGKPAFIHNWVSVCYLNDDYLGGETLVENIRVTPNKVRVTLFNSKQLYHGVAKTNAPRYTYIAWWE